MGLRETGFAIIVFCVVVITYSLYRLVQRFEKTAEVLEGFVASTEQQLKTTIDTLNTTLEQIGSATVTVEDQVRKIERITNVTHGVLESIRLTSAVVQKTVASPIAGVSGVMAGLAKGVSTLATRHSGRDKA